MSKHYHKKSISVRDEHYLWLAWADWFNYSSFFQSQLEEEMQLRDDDPEAIAAAIDHAREQGWTIDDLAAETESYQDLTELLKEIKYSQQTPGDHSNVQDTTDDGDRPSSQTKTND